MQITLQNALPSQFTDGSTPQAFLRVWQQQLTFTPGTAIELGTTGLFVTLSTNKTSAGTSYPFHASDYWLIAVRPSTPTQLYPQRYLDAPQPPDGPRMWVCPLAAIEWGSSTLKVDESCLKQFTPLLPPAMHVTQTSWSNDDFLSVDAFVTNGLQVTLDGWPDALSVSSSTMVVTLEVPTLTAASRQAAAAAYQSLILAGQTQVNPNQINQITWAPGFPESLLLQYFTQRDIPVTRLRARVTLKGHEIWSGASEFRQGRLYLDGQAFGEPGVSADGTTPRLALSFPSGANALASDFESWFWLIPPPTVTVSPAALNFGNEPVNNKRGPDGDSDQYRRLAGDDHQYCRQRGFHPEQHVPATSASNVLQPGAHCTISISFTPTATGTRTGALAITDNAIGSPQTVSLSGNGTAPAVSLNPASLTFPRTLVGQSSTPLTVTLTNTGTAVLNIANATATGDFSVVSHCGPTVAANANCQLCNVYTHGRWQPDRKCNDHR